MDELHKKKIDELLALSEKPNLAKYLGVEFIEANKNKVVASLKIHDNVKQPWGYIHGGAIVTLADSIAGVGSAFHVDSATQIFITTDLSCNFIKALKYGTIIATARPTHIGKQMHLWQVEVRDESDDSLISTVTIRQLISPKKMA